MKERGNFCVERGSRMLRKNRLKEKVRNKEEAFGLFCSIPSPIIVEMIGCADYDFVIIDTEHVLINPETLENMIRAGEAAGLTVLVRVPDDNPGNILRALDGGAQGVVVPHVESKEQAEKIVKASRYYPHGTRSLNGGRPGSFGKSSLVAYMERANEEILVVPMIESAKGAEHVKEILSVPGIDMVLEGAADLSQSLGVPWQTSSEIVQKTLKQVHQVSMEQKVPYCAIPRKQEDVDTWRELGVHTFVLGDERGISFRALKFHLEAFGKMGVKS